MHGYLKSIEPSQEQNWYRYVVWLDDAGLSRLIDRLVSAGRGEWSFKPARRHPTDTLPVDLEYVFFLKDAHDAVLVRDFEHLGHRRPQ